MKAFDEAVERLDEIKVPKELESLFIKAMQNISHYIDTLDGVELDFDKLFERALYGALNIKLVDEFDRNIGGHYVPLNNTITVKRCKNYKDFDVHVFTHEFIHFIIHQSYPNLPTWADEMMTEYTASKISGARYGTYIGLLTFADLFEENFEKLDVAEFLNGNFNEFIKKYQLDQIVEPLNRCAETSTGNSQDLQKAIEHLVNIKAQILMQNKVDFENYMQSLIKMYSKRTLLDKQSAIDSLSRQALNFAQQNLSGNEQNATSIRHQVEALFVQFYMENKLNTKLNSMQKFSINGVQNYVAYGNDGAYIFINFNGNISEIDKLENGHQYEFSISNNSVSYQMCAEGSTNITLSINGDPILYNSNTKRFEIPYDNSTEIDLQNNTIMEQLKCEIADMAYEAKCKPLLRAQNRIKSSDENIKGRINQLNAFAKALNAQLYCTAPTKYTTSGEDKTLYYSPIYYLQQNSEKESTKINDINLEKVDSLADLMEFGDQVVIYGKDSSQSLIPMANIFKEAQDNEFSIHFNYGKFIKLLPKEYQQSIYQSLIPKQSLDNIIDKER